MRCEFLNEILFASCSIDCYSLPTHPNSSTCIQTHSETKQTYDVGSLKRAHLLGSNSLKSEFCFCHQLPGNPLMIHVNFLSSGFLICKLDIELTSEDCSEGLNGLILVKCLAKCSINTNHNSICFGHGYYSYYYLLSQSFTCVLPLSNPEL